MAIRCGNGSGANHRATPSLRSSNWNWKTAFPRNPFVNAGAIVTVDALLQGRVPKATLADIVRFIRTAASDDDTYINEHIARDENETGFRNHSLGYFALLQQPAQPHYDQVLGTYFHLCAIEMSCVTGARRTLSGRPARGTSTDHLAAWQHQRPDDECRSLQRLG